MNLKKTSGTIIAIKLLIAIPVISSIMISFSSCARDKKWEAKLTKISVPPLHPAPPKPPTMVGSDTTWQLVDEVPMFPGGEKLLEKFISKNTQYPEAARLKGTQGQVIVKFCISSKGKLSGYEIVKSVSPELDAEALRVIKTLIRFEPGMKDGKPVASWHYLPISFVLH